MAIKTVCVHVEKFSVCFYFSVCVVTKHYKCHCVALTGIQLPRAVLIYGPSGIGKTMLVQAVAHSMQLHLVTVGGSAILSPYYSTISYHIISYHIFYL